MRPYYYLGGRRGLTQLSTGQMFIVNTDARDIATWIIHAGIWETFVDDILCALVRPGDTFVDVGANMGYYTIKVGARVGAGGRVYSFEPNPSLFDVLHDNIQINGAGNYSQAFLAAAGETAGVATLSFEPRYPGGGHLSAPGGYLDPNLTKAEVPVMRIDDVVTEGRVDLVKIDVEGFEPMVLKGMTGLLANSPDAAVVTEVSFSQWARFGDPGAMLRSFAGDRRIFLMRVDGKIEELPKDDIETALNRNYPSYILLLPQGAARDAQIRRFIQPYQEREGLEVDQPIPPKPSLLYRLRRRLSPY